MSPRAFIFQTLEALAREYEKLAAEPHSTAKALRTAPPPDPPEGPRVSGFLRRVLSVLAPTSKG